MNSEARCYSYLRFSNPNQKKGDSARRQIEAAEKYAQENGLKLDKTLKLHDEGLSGFTGKHIKEGNLGKFLALIEAGKIAPDSRLIIESIDRLGRQEPLTATDVIKLILRAGIVLVVLDWYRVREFTDESIRNNPGEYSGLVAEIERAYFESKKKSERLSEAWKEKRKKAKKGGKKLTGMCPLWLKLSKDKTEFIEIPERVEAVNQIFKMKANGFGNGQIAKELNKNPDIWQPAKSKRNKTGGWPESTIQRILKEKRVLGEFQPHTKVDGKREPVGDPIKDYYPAIVDEDLFFAVQNRMQQWRKKHGHPGGRAHKAKNLFTHIAECGKCGNRMHYSHKGSKGKEGGYLRCSLAMQPGRAKKGKGCDARSIYYNHFMETFFKYVTELKPSDILPTSDEHNEKISELSKTIDANGERINKLVEKEENYIKAIGDDYSPKQSQKIQQELDRIEHEREELSEYNQQLIQQRIDLEKQAKEIQTNLNTLDEFKNILASADSEDEAIKIRLKIRRTIRKIVERIEVFPSKKTTGRYDKVMITFKGADPFARLLTYTDNGWKQLTRMKAPIN